MFYFGACISALLLEQVPVDEGLRYLTALVQQLQPRSQSAELRRENAELDQRVVVQNIVCLTAIVISGLANLACTAEPNQTEEGFVCLFDGKTLEGWQGSVEGYQVQNGSLVCLANNKAGHLLTTEQYGDFVLRIEFQLSAGANNGLGIRCPLTGNAGFEGMELQILDDSASKYADLKPYQFHGSIYGVVPAKRGHLKPVGQWNQQEVVCQGPRITVKLNGAVIVDADVSEVAKNGALDGESHPGLKRTQGHIAFFGHGSRVAFRNIRIKTLP